MKTHIQSDCITIDIDLLFLYCHFYHKVNFFFFFFYETPTLFWRHAKQGSYIDTTLTSYAARVNTCCSSTRHSGSLNLQTRLLLSAPSVSLLLLRVLRPPGRQQRTCNLIVLYRAEHHGSVSALLSRLASDVNVSFTPFTTCQMDVNNPFPISMKV